MSKTTQHHSTVKSENVLIIGCITLILGFLLGVILTIYRIGPTVGHGMEAKHTDGAPADADQLRMEIEQLKSLLEKQPEDSNLLIHLGNLYFDTDQANEAIKAYEKALLLSPDNADVWTDLGVMYRRSRLFEKAIEAFSKAITIDPSHEISRFNKGIVLLNDLKDTQEAIAVWKELLKINPGASTPNGQPLSALIDSVEKKTTP